MRWVAIFDDTPDMLAVRVRREADHLAYLQRHAAEIVLAGGLREAVGEAFVGGLWIMEVDSRARAVALVEADPYFEAQGRRYKLLVWGKAFPELRVLL